VGLWASFAVAAWFFLGGFGLLLVAMTALVWWVLAPPRSILWLLAVVCLASAPVAMVLQGVISPRPVGPLFGVQHLLAARLVEVSVALAAFVAATEGLGLEPPVAARARTLDRLARLLRSGRPREADGNVTQDPAEPHPGD